MPDQRISSRIVAIEHVTIRSGKTFAAVKARLETIIPSVDTAIFALLRRREAAKAVARLNAAPPLSIFSTRDHGHSLTGLAGQTRGAIQYETGNSLTASEMTREVISAALYAPIRVLLREDGDGAPTSIRGGGVTLSRSQRRRQHADGNERGEGP